MAVFVFSYPLIYLTGLLQVDSIGTKRTQRKVRNASVQKRAGPGESTLRRYGCRVLTRAGEEGVGGGDAAPPLVDCKWQSKFTLTAGAKMGSDSFVRESERLSGRAGIWMISPPFHLQIADVRS